MFLLFPLLLIVLSVCWICTELGRSGPAIRITLGLATVMMIGAIGVIAFQFGKVEPGKERAMMHGALRNIRVIAKSGDNARIESLIRTYEADAESTSVYAAALKFYERSDPNHPDEQSHP